MTTFKKVDYFIGKLLEVLITVSLGLVTVITFLQVIFRYVLSQPLTWAQEALMIAFVYSIIFGAALAMRNNEHLKVDIFENLPKPIHIAFQVLEFIIVGTVIVVIFHYGIILVIDNFNSGQTMSTIPIQMAFVYMVLPVSSVFMMYYHIRRVFSWFG